MATAPAFIESVFRDEISGVRARTLTVVPEGPAALAPVLTDRDVKDLQDFFRYAEGDALSCNQPPTIGERGSDEFGQYDARYGCDAVMVALIDSRRVRTARWVRERLLRMEDRGQGLSVVVLHLLFGHRPAGTDPAPCADDAGKSEPSPWRDLAAIVHLTEAVEDERHRMGGRLGAARAQRTEDAIAGTAETIAWAEREIAALDAALAEPEPRLHGSRELPEERAFWASAGQLVTLDARIDEEADEATRDRLEERRHIRWTGLERKLSEAMSAIATAAKPQRAELLRRRNAWRKVAADAQTVQAMGDDASHRAIQTAYCAPTRELTAGDVLRARAHYDAPAGLSAEEAKAHRKAWRDGYDSWVAKVRNQGERLRLDAFTAFANARFAE